MWEAFGSSMCLALAHQWSPGCFRGRANLRIRLASKHALNERRCFDESARLRKPRCLEHHVIHFESFPFLWKRTMSVVLIREVLFATRFFVTAFYRLERP